MALLSSYLIIVTIAAIVAGLGCWFKKYLKNNDVFFAIFSVIIGLVFFFRYMSGDDAIEKIYKLESNLFDNKFENFLGLISVWFSYVAILMCMLSGFFRNKTTKRIMKFLVLPLAIINVGLLRFNIISILGNTKFSLRFILMSIEAGLVLAMSVLAFVYFFKERKDKEKNTVELPFKYNWFQKMFVSIGTFFKKYWFGIFIVLIVFTAVMPPYMVQGLFGHSNLIMPCNELKIPHRIVLYIGIILPFLIHFSLKDQDFKTRKFALMYICFGTLISFSLHHRFESFTTITDWPIHLCNTAMYIMPIVLMFNMKRFFYFTYFINVAGSFIAMMIPNTAGEANILSTSISLFYVNHYIAFFMPILFVSLGMFERPKMKQFIYSMIAFVFYYAFVLYINAWITGMHEIGEIAKTSDFFFTNSDFVAEKLGKWCENLRETTAVLKVGRVRLTFYPLYQLGFFIGYVLIGLLVWFIFEQGYQIADRGRDMKKREEKIRLDKIALMSELKGRSIMEPVKVDSTDKLILKNFSKRYGNSKHFAVKDASLEIHGGEIFGFLGPNGAGKSTIIKSVVGIQPITEGQIFVCGYDVDKQSVMAKQQIGFVPDHYALYEKLTGREYINYIADLYNVSKKDRDERIESLITRLELKSAFDNQIKTYSHGMKQKIAIISALVHDPKLWILDEPLTGLDPNSIMQVKECMKEHAAKGNIVFFSSHIIDVVEKICDRIGIIKKGQIQTCKTLKEIEKDGNTLENFYMNIINGEDNGKN
ncbi:MAG: YwaF family protein [Clostridia bacterium]|nr:YwaF family protein [Clostridia bacterium]